jgi:hypothetical protein
MKLRRVLFFNVKNNDERTVMKENNNETRTTIMEREQLSMKRTTM